MRNIEKTASGLFDKLRNRFSPIKIRDEKRESTLDPEKARFFSFDYTANGKNFGSITISVLGKDLKVFYAQDLDQFMSPIEKKQWFKFLKELRFFAMSEGMVFDVRDIGKSGLNLRDLKYLNKDSEVYSKDEVNVSESKLYGTRRSSYQQLEDVRIIARHNKPIVDETIPGVRSRNVESFYIENSQGERFKLPQGTTINGARAYARHIKNGGQLHDDFGQHIGRMIKEMADLRMFVRNMRGRTFEDIETQQMVESAIDHYGRLHSDLHLIRSQRGYDQYRELWQPEVLEETEFDLTELRDRFVRKVFDDRLTSALPVVFREYNRRKMATEQEFESWANDIVREFEENPIDKENKKKAMDGEDIEEDSADINVKSPFANSLRNVERDSAENIVDDNENQNFAGLLNEKGFEFRFEDGVYYFESKDEIERAKDWISLKFPKMKFPKMGVYDYGYGVYGSTTFDRELPGGKGVMESKKNIKELRKHLGFTTKAQRDALRASGSKPKGPQFLFSELASMLHITGPQLLAIANTIPGFPKVRLRGSITQGSKGYYDLEEFKKWVIKNNIKDVIASKKYSKQSARASELKEFAPGSGDDSGRWYTDDQMIDMVGPDWAPEDDAGHLTLGQRLQDAQAWLDDQGYSVVVEDVQIDPEGGYRWKIYGEFYNPRFAKRDGMQENVAASMASEFEQHINENLRKWFKEKWVRFGPDGKIRGQCARDDDSEGKPKCLPQSKAQALGKKGRASAASRKRREDPNPERSGKAINVATKKKTNESMLEGQHDRAADEYRAHLIKTMPQLMKFFDQAVKGWRPTQEQMMAAIETAYTVMKYTGDIKQAGQTMMDELNTLHRMSQGQQGVTEGQVNELAPNPGGGDGGGRDDGDDGFELPLDFKGKNVLVWPKNKKYSMGDTATPFPRGERFTGKVYIMWDGPKIEAIFYLDPKDREDREAEYERVYGPQGRGWADWLDHKWYDTTTPRYRLVTDWRLIPAKEPGGWPRIVDAWGQDMIDEVMNTAQDFINEIIHRDGDGRHFVEPKQNVTEGLTKQAKARKEAEAVITVIKRLEAELKDPNPHLNKADIQRRLDNEKRRLELYRDVLDEQSVAEDSLNEFAPTKVVGNFNRGGGGGAGRGDDGGDDDRNERDDSDDEGIINKILQALERLQPDPFETYGGEVEDVVVNLVSSGRLDDYIRAVGMGNVPMKELIKQGVVQTLKELKELYGNQGVQEGRTMCPECGGPAYSNSMLAEKQDACYHKVRSRYKVWPSAYASGALVQCRKKGAKNWGNKSK